MHEAKQTTPTTPVEGPAFCTTAQREFQQGGRRRMVGAVLVALVALTALILLGPSKEDVERRFEYYGAPDDLRIMPEISIEEGADQIRQLPKTLLTPPPPSRIEIEPEELDENAKDPRPREADRIQEQPEDWPTTEPVPLTDLVETNQVKLALPRQSNPDWYILAMVMPEYPLEASESLRRIPVIQVKVGIFVNPDGDVAEAMIQTQSPAVFNSEVLAKVKQWKFGWRVDPRAGRWIVLPFDFRSPYTRPVGSRD